MGHRRFHHTPRSNHPPSLLYTTDTRRLRPALVRDKEHATWFGRLVAAMTTTLEVGLIPSRRVSIWETMRRSTCGGGGVSVDLCVFEGEGRAMYITIKALQPPEEGMSKPEAVRLLTSPPALSRLGAMASSSSMKRMEGAFFSASSNAWGVCRW